MDVSTCYKGEFIEDPLHVKRELHLVERTNLFGSRKKPKRGKVKDVYELDENLLLIYFTDRISAFDVVLPTLVPYKGFSLAGLTDYWFKRGSKIFPNHFIETVDVNLVKVVKAKRIDIEWIARRYLYGSLWKAYSTGRRLFNGVRLPDGLEIAEELHDIILTPTTKSEVGHDKEISKREAVDRGLISEDEWKELEEATLKLYEFYEREAKRRNVILADLKLEFGRYRDELIQIDEPPTHDSARLWIEEGYEVGRTQVDNCLDKEFLREYLRRVGFTGDGEPPRLPREVVREVSKRCLASYLILSGQKSVKDFSFSSIEEVA